MVKWEALAVILGGIALLGAAVTALPPIWRFICRIASGIWVFLKAAAKAPHVIEKILDEFVPNGGGSMRDSIDRLTKVTDALTRDMGHLRLSNHELVQEITAAVGTAQVTARMVERHAKVIAAHTADDKTQFQGIGSEVGQMKEQVVEVLRRLGEIDSQLKQASILAAEVKHDLGHSNELNELGRMGRLERREDDYRKMLSHVEKLNAELVEMNARYMAEADKVTAAAGVVAENLAVAKTGVEKVAADLAESHKRANAEASGKPGAAADAAARIDVDENTEEGG